MYRREWPSGYGRYNDAEVLQDCINALGTDAGAVQETMNDVYAEAFGKGASARFTKATLAHFAIMSVHPTQRTIARAITLITNRYLFSRDRAESKIPVIGYRTDPSMGINEMVNAVLDVRIAGLGLPMPSTALVSVTDLSMLVRHYIVLLGQMFGRRQALIDRLEAYTRDLCFRLQDATLAAGAMDQWDKSFIMHMTSMRYGSSGNLTASRLQDLTVSQVIDDLKKTADAGPKSRYVGVISNGSVEELSFYIGPLAPRFKVAVGAEVPFGNFSSLKLDVVADIPWVAQNQLLGSAEALGECGALINLRKIGTALRAGDECVEGEELNPVLRVQVDYGRQAIPLIADYPAMSVAYEQERLIFSYYSKMRSRLLRDVNGPTELIIEDALGSNPSGTAANTPIVGNLSLDQESFCDLSMVRDRIINLDMEIPVYYLRNRNFESKTVSMKDVLSILGDKAVKPAFSEYWRPRISDLFVEEPKYEQWIMQRLGLLNSDQVASQVGVRISYNWWKIGQLFGAQVFAPKDVVQFTRTILTGQPTA